MQERAVDPTVNFVPMRGDFTRGILASVYTDCDPRQEEAARSIVPPTFTPRCGLHLRGTIAPHRPQTGRSTPTRRCGASSRNTADKLHIVSVIDNLLKGASGQAVQNMNLLFGLDETAGLQLKASAF